MEDQLDIASLPLAATAAALAVGSTALYYWHHQQQDDTKDEEIIIDLLPVEKVLAGGGGGDNAISTLTWLEGNHTKALPLLRERALSILTANPWLGGRIAKRGGSGYALVYSKHPQEKTANIDRHVQCLLEETDVSRAVPLEQLGAKLSHLMLKNGPSQVLWKITKHVAIFQDDIQSLVVERIASTEDQQIQAMGGAAEYKILQSPGFIANCIYGVLKTLVFRKYKASSRIYLIDAEGMEAAKKEVMASATNKAQLSSFVSTNDVLTCWFLQTCSCRHGFMALNFRGRLQGHSNLHAGNYENVIFYHQQDSASPRLIRQSITSSSTSKDDKLLLQRCETRDQPFPSFGTMATGSVAIASNWASFAKPCSIPNCKEDVQIPLYNVESLLPSTMAIMLIFRAGGTCGNSNGNGSRLAVLVSGSPDKLEQLGKDAPFLSNQALV